jgi:hypothetical protein
MQFPSDIYFERTTYDTLQSKKVKLSHYHHAGAKGTRRYSSYTFLTSALGGMSGRRHAPAALYSWERTPGTHWIGGWVSLRAGLDTQARVKILCLCWGSNPGHPICSRLLIRFKAHEKYYISKLNCLLYQCNNTNPSLILQTS